MAGDDLPLTKRESDEPKVQWSHSTLLSDLLVHLETSEDYIVGEPVWGPSGSIRPDVLRFRKSYTRIDIQVYEVKSNRSDFLGEIRNGKWQEYIPRCTRFFFATPLVGVIRYKSEVPETAGWIARSERGWRVITPPKIRQIVPSYEEILALLMNLNSRNKSLEMQLEAAKKSDHFNRIDRNRQLWSRLEEYRRISRSRRQARSDIIEAREELQKVLGLSLGGYRFAEDVRRWARDKRAGFPVSKVQSALDCIESLRERFDDAVRSLEDAMKNHKEDENGTATS